MSEEKFSQSFSISGGQVFHAQIGGQAGHDLTATQNQQINQNESQKPLTQTDVIELIVQLEELFRHSGLPEVQTTKAIKHLEAAKEETQEEKPDKDFAAKNLQRATKVIKEASETVEAGTSFWQKVKPILETVSPWFEVASSFFM